MAPLSLSGLVRERRRSDEDLGAIKARRMALRLTKARMVSYPSGVAQRDYGSFDLERLFPWRRAMAVGRLLYLYFGISVIRAYDIMRLWSTEVT